MVRSEETCSCIHRPRYIETVMPEKGNTFRAVIKRWGYYEHGPRLLSKENKRKIEPNETPSCLIPCLLVVFTLQLEIFSDKSLLHVYMPHLFFHLLFCTKFLEFNSTTFWKLYYFKNWCNVWFQKISIDTQWYTNIPGCNEFSYVLMLHDHLNVQWCMDLGKETSTYMHSSNNKILVEILLFTKSGNGLWCTKELF